MVSRDSPISHQIYSFDAAVKKKFPVLSLVWYLFNVVSSNIYLIIGSNGNVFVARWILPLVTKPILDLVVIH